MDLKIFSQKDDPGRIDQYCQPLNFELAGKKFILVMDDGFDFHLNIIDNQYLKWNVSGKKATKAKYKCVKGDDTTYLLSYQLIGEIPRKSHTFVIDLDNMLTTRVISQMGTNPKYPYLIKTDFEFGAIREDGKDLPFKRHGYTSDMIGNVVKWTYGTNAETVHIYYCSNFYRITYPSDRIVTEGAPAFGSDIAEALKALPSSDEPTVSIKIKEGMYLFSLTEANMEKYVGDKVPFRSNTMCMLQNYKRMYQVGRTFGTMTINGVDKEIDLMFSAYGKFFEVDPSFLTDPNPYIV